MPKAPTKSTTGKKPFGRFKVLRGSHNEGGKTYHKGDIVESASDLLKHNRPFSVKFGSADDVVETQPTEPEEDDFYGEMEQEQLQQIADEGNIDISGCSSKEEVIAKLKANE